jgi:hypothetical protein
MDSKVRSYSASSKKYLELLYNDNLNDMNKQNKDKLYNNTLDEINNSIIE